MNTTPVDALHAGGVRQLKHEIAASAKTRTKRLLLGFGPSFAFAKLALPNEVHARDANVNHQRPLWIVIFALMVAAVAIRLNASDPDVAFQPDGTQETATSDARTDIQLNGHIYEVVRHRSTLPTQRWLGRPKSVSFQAVPVNVDADADPDGWSVEIALLDANGNRIRRRASARFTLNPRVPTQDFTGYVTANQASASWSSKLDFDEDGIARVRLPLRERLSPVFGCQKSPHRSVGIEGGRRSTVGGVRRRADHREFLRSGLSTSQLYGASVSSLGLPAFGELRVTVSVPTEGVFKAVAAIQLRPSVLVDTRWPYQ